METRLRELGLLRLEDEPTVVSAAVVCDLARQLCRRFPPEYGPAMEAALDVRPRAVRKQQPWKEDTAIT